MMSQKAYHVFLAYNDSDRPAVECLAHRLVQAGFQPWFADWNLIPGEPFQEQHEVALQACATCTVFIGPGGTSGWQTEQMRVAIARRVAERANGFRVIPVLLPGAERGERSRLPEFLVNTTWVEFRTSLDDEQAFHRLLCGIRGIEPGPGPGQATYEGICPYRGLHVFNLDDAPFFFGREARTEWLLDAIQPIRGTTNGTLQSSRPENRFLGIIGPSGSGKSSLARAGLIAALQRGALPGSEQWPVVIMRPGVDPIESLVLALAIAQTPAEISREVHEFQANERALHQATRLRLHDAPLEQRLILLVDQFEEVFTLCRDKEARTALIANLLYAARVEQGQTLVIITIRADFYGACATSPQLAAALSDEQDLVGPMTADELRRAIERPAHLAGSEFEPGLVETLLDEVQDQPGSLPLLQHALYELWQHRAGRQLSRADYEAIGGVAGALEQRAETLFTSFSLEEQAACQRLFLRLTRPGDGSADTPDTKRRVAFSEFLPDAGTPEVNPQGHADQAALERVIQMLADARLVITSGASRPDNAAAESDLAARAERYVEVAHETLIRSWSRLRNWIRDNREALRLRHQITEAASSWEKSGRDPGELFRGAKLERATEYDQAHPGDLNTLEREFIQVGTALRTHEARQRQRGQQVAIAAVLLTIITLVVGGLAGLAWQQRGRAIQSEQTAVAAQATAEAAQADIAQLQRETLGLRLAETARNLKDPTDLSLLLAVQAGQMAETFEADRALREWLSHPIKPVARLQHDGPVWTLQWNRDETRILTTSRDGTARVWDVTSGDELARLQHDGQVLQAWWSRDETRILTISVDNIVRVWDVASETELAHLHHDGWVDRAQWNSDEMRILTSSDDGVVRLWDATSGTELLRLQHDGRSTQAQWNSDEMRILTSSDDGVVRLWDATSGTELLRLQHDGRSTQAQWNEDETRILTSSEDGTARVWDAASGTELLRLYHDGWVNRAEWNGDETRILTSSVDNTVRVWDAASGAELARLQHDGVVTQAQWNEDETRILTASADNTVRVWDTTNGAELLHLRHDEAIQQARWNEDETRILTISHDKTVHIWDAENGSELARRSVVLPSNAAFSDINPLKTVVLRSPEWFTAQWNADETRLLAASEDSMVVWVWDVQSGAELVRLQHERTVNRAAWNRDESRILTSSEDGTARVWDVQNGAELVRLRHEGTVSRAAWNRDESRILTASADGTARVWDAQSGAELIRLQHEGTVNQAAWNRDESRILTASADGTVRVWDARSGVELVRLQHDGAILQAQWNSDETRILTSNEDDTVRVWDARSGAELLRLHPKPKGWFVDAQWNRDESRILTVTRVRNGNVQMWDAQNGEELANFQHEGLGWWDDDMVPFMIDAQLNGDETRIVTCTDDGARIWDIQRGSELVRLPDSGCTYRVQWSTDGSRILTSRAGMIRIVDAERGVELAHFAHDGIDDAQWNADESRVMSRGSDNTVRLWDVASRQELARLNYDQRIYQAQWNRDETHVLITSEDGTARVYLMPGVPLRDYACRFAVRNLTLEEWNSYLPNEPYRKTCPYVPLEASFVDDLVQQHEHADGTVNLNAVLAAIHTTLERSPQGNQNPDEEARQTLAQALVRTGQAHAATGDYTTAEAFVYTAANMDPMLDVAALLVGIRSTAVAAVMTQIYTRALTGDFDPELTEAQVRAAAELDSTINTEELLATIYALQSLNEIHAGRVSQGLVAFEEAQNLDPDVISDEDWNSVCWWGSLARYADNPDGPWLYADAILAACEQAVALDPSNGGRRDSRGVARALTGDYTGAIEDFTAYIEWATEEHEKNKIERIARRDEWITDLEAGRNPFDAATLEALREE